MDNSTCSSCQIIRMERNSLKLIRKLENFLLLPILLKMFFHPDITQRVYISIVSEISGLLSLLFGSFALYLLYLDRKRISKYHLITQAGIVVSRKGFHFSLIKISLIMKNDRLGACPLTTKCIRITR